MEYFPSVDQLRQGLAEQSQRPEFWRETNLRLIAEFAAKTTEALIEAPLSIEGAGSNIRVWPISHWSLGGHSLRAVEDRFTGIALSEGSEPLWWVETRGAAKSFYDRGDLAWHSRALDTLESLSAWDPTSLHGILFSQLPR